MTVTLDLERTRRRRERCEAVAGRAWAPFGASVVGASHVKSGKPNQDAFDWRVAPGAGVVIAAADGHGGAPHYRSGEGSAIAAHLAVELGADFLARHAGDGADALADAGNDLIPAVINAWVASVDRLGDGSLTPFGTTLLYAVIGRRAALLVQVGDGDIVVASPSASHRPVPGDDRLWGNVTTSLCLPTALEDTRTAVIDLAPGDPSLVWLSTDGYANSFEDDAGFLAVGPDVVNRLTRDGLAAVSAQLPTWLARSAGVGGDDTTLVAAARIS